MKNPFINLCIKAAIALGFVAFLMLGSCSVAHHASTLRPVIDNDSIHDSGLDLTGIDTTAKRCETDTLGLQIGDDTQRRSFSTSPAEAKTVTFTAVIDKQVANRFGSDEKTLSETRLYLQELQKGILDLVNVKLEFPYIWINGEMYGSSTSVNKQKFKQDIPVVNTDAAVYINFGNQGLSDRIGGVGDPNYNRCVIFTNYTWPKYIPNQTFTYTNATTNGIHEFLHVLGLCESFACAHTDPITGEKYRPIDIYGNLCYNYAYCRATDRPIPGVQPGFKQPLIAPINSYAGLCKGKFGAFLLPSQRAMVDNVMSNVSPILGSANPVYDLKFENGAISFKDDYNTTHKIRIAPVVLGNTQFPPYETVSSATAETLELTGTPYKDNASGITGMRYDADFSGYDEIRYDVAGTGGKMLYSLWNGNTSVTGAMDLPMQGALTIDKNLGKLTRLQARKSTLQSTLSIENVRLVRASSGGNKTVILFPNLKPKTAYVFEVWREDLKGRPVQLFFTTP